jgi:multimeric flavodoxin WrbA
MSKKVLIITASMRKNSNSDMLAEAFAKGAKEAGNSVETISLKDKEIKYCIGCLACQRTGKCVLKDDAAEIVEKAKNADVIAFASPVYYYSISGQLKTMLDRLNPLFASEYRFRDIYFLSTAYENGKTTVKGSVTALQGWIDCFEKARLAGTVFAGGVNEPAEIKGHPSLDQAYQLGKKI